MSFRILGSLKIGNLRKEDLTFSDSVVINILLFFQEKPLCGCPSKKTHPAIRYRGIKVCLEIDQGQNEKKLIW